LLVAKWRPPQTAACHVRRSAAIGGRRYMLRPLSLLLRPGAAAVVAATAAAAAGAAAGAAVWPIW